MIASTTLKNVGVTDIKSNAHETAKLLMKEFVTEYNKNRSKDVIDGVDNVLDTAIITKDFTIEDLVEKGLDAVASRIINAS